VGGRLVGTASRLLDVAVGGLLIVVVAITLAQVVARYMLGTALIWSEEFTRLVHVWMVALAAVRAAHMRIEFFLDRMGRRTRLAAELLNATLSVLLLGLLARGAWSMVELTAYDTFTAMPVSVQYLHLSLVVAGSLWLLVVLGRTWRLVRPA
jgi:TRAP-type transport system small permease protein